MKKFLPILAVLGACSTAPGTTPAIDAQTALWYLKAAGCLTEALAQSAQPIVQAVNPGGGVVLGAVVAGTTLQCNLTVPASAVVVPSSPAPVPAPATKSP